MRRREFVKTMTALGAGLILSPDSRFALHAEEFQPDPGVKRVLVMFKCHFDAGFIDTQAHVVHKYFSQYFPQAIRVARDANASGKRRYVWTTGSWLLFEYLDQAQPAERKLMEQAIARGDIAWHALPFTWQSEMLDPSMIEGSLALSHSLDRRFGKVTTGAKMTDVPGHTRGLIRPLAEHGVNFLEIGVNGGSTPAQLPPIFLWKDPSGASLPVMYHHEYGGIVRIPGSDVALVTSVRDDNSGPHTLEEIASIHADLSARFPNAEIRASSLTEMAQAIQPHRDRLPVMTQEVGDTWIHGCASDPLKVARYREVSRLRERWIAQGALQIGDAADLALLRHVLLEAEHTWGTDTKTWLDFDNYKPADLARMLDTKNYKVVEFSWVEKRQDLFTGINTLPENLRTQAQHAIENLKPVVPVMSAKAVLHPDGKPIETAHFTLAIDHETGAITQLRNKSTGREWASPRNPVALLSYQTLSKEDYDRFIASYLTTKADWAFKDFGKPNIGKFGAVSQIWEPRSANVHVEETEEAHRILAQVQFQDEAAFQSGRASFPRKAFLEVLLPKAEPVLHLRVSCFQKPATRLPEAIWLTFNPVTEGTQGWALEKCGEQISPFDVVASGNRHMHAVSKGFEYRNGTHSFAVETVDSPVVALGARTPLGFSNRQPDLSSGIHSCLFNNAWGTNYIMWYGEDMCSRYVVRPS
ncbi:MAG TPA: DUF5054 domain-containing protein [Terracidiphilus sp.]|nr:DUF5054 domain-containing protein [Terracidiphilus sp.]